MIKAIPMEDWLRGCIYHDGRHGYVTLPIDKVHQIANYIQRTRQSGMDGLIDLCGYGEHKADRKTEPSNSEKPNNCEHITEDGVTCAKYPACDYCLDNPLNKVKGSERLLKGKDEPTISKMEQVDKDINVRSKTEPQMGDAKPIPLSNRVTHIKDEPQTNADQHVQRVEYVENDERSRCWKCKHFERMHETPISSDGKYYTYVVCTAKECNYEPKDKPQTCSVNGRPYDCGKCEYFRCTADEPQIQLTARCLNCNNAKACKEKHWSGCIYEPIDDEPQTEDEILREQCRAFMGIVEQTERSE